MKIHEYQGKEIFRKYGVPTPKGILALSPNDAEAAAKELATPVVVVKAQIHAGGRGKGGGVKLAKSPAEAKELAKQMLGMMLKTIQTGPEGTKVHKVYIEEGLAIGQELYLGVTLDRVTSRVTFMASREGGVEIEEVAEKHPEKILRETVDPAVGFLDFQGRNLAFGLGLSGPTVNKFAQFCTALYRMFIETDASLVEINPLVILKDGGVVALDAKVTFDENAIYRHKDLLAYRDLAEEDARETQAKEWDLAYIALEGNIGCMVNGAGLAMATMDTIKLVGGSPANFLDVGGGASKEKVTAAFKLILADPAVKAVLVNIFGGIMKCDVIADGIIAAAKEVQLKVPLIVRLEGTNVEQGKELLRNSGLAITPADNLRQAAEKAVAALK
ncbi:ADP-forming succinate--CoA ligase subunit beta [Myxococcus sp. CA051A]|uniref:Succinate--CoA ligase [ADP-forming] subunit beta n=1 Tax=Myxococcus llanfairpwllgwyngyllgogerychwyrndrobwllllantysiliogogogochensis TaxID=2590453 RepID=A0A540WTV0_9BACT|nr:MULTISPECIES: ADP-forming succinate--CoA ligase subunit beta [Myxococcus]NTX06958.1 ADP-forming succinate--CoA ligase subunit beta [Myxococcus sp. CA040A]NTX13730.1 ADP-forming succinate--CoA ligase subunit beta [Myxococcus sp. CA056]NTX38588.1 ADP-forming succinate--CoA ligase subunit beta [Myxococcus sp. CA033]NTX53970.1 ADP-forming succinate--CoA ligase subunit beta [Myxococcus sp. CA039A]NTX62349.1 ADP-forming succinate--CoA ligase subunit beta [Myxococcus sp. CA051A]